MLYMFHLSIAFSHCFYLLPDIVIPWLVCFDPLLWAPYDLDVGAPLNPKHDDEPSKEAEDDYQPLKFPALQWNGGYVLPFIDVREIRKAFDNKSG